MTATETSTLLEWSNSFKKGDRIKSCLDLDMPMTDENDNYNWYTAIIVKITTKSGCLSMDVHREPVAEWVSSWHVDIDLDNRKYFINLSKEWDD